jgi:hypothetical protein
MPNVMVSPLDGQVDINWVMGKQFPWTFTWPADLTGAVISLISTPGGPSFVATPLPYTVSGGVTTVTMTGAFTGEASAALGLVSFGYNVSFVPAAGDPANPLLMFGGTITIALT